MSDGKRIGSEVPIHVYLWLNEEAKARGISLADVIRVLLHDAMRGSRVNLASRDCASNKVQ